MAPPTVPATRTGTEHLEAIQQRLTPEHFIDEGADADKVFLAGLLQRFDPAPLLRMSYREMDRECPEVDRQLIELHGCAAAVLRDDLDDSGWVDTEVVEILVAVADLLESQRFYIVGDGRWVRHEEWIAEYRAVMDHRESVPRA